VAIIVEAPNEIYSIQNETENLKVFVAGGMSNCPNWQQEFIQEFKNYNYITLFNPRRAEFDTTDPKASEKQIVWEYRHLEEADVIIYWFSRGSLNPIVLYELGKYINTDKKIIIGIDPEYERKSDVEIQSKLTNYKDKFYTTIKDMANAIRSHIIN